VRNGRIRGKTEKRTSMETVKKVLEVEVRGFAFLEQQAAFNVSRLGVGYWGNRARKNGGKERETGGKNDWCQARLMNHQFKLDY